MIILGDEKRKNEKVIHWVPTFHCNYRCEYCYEKNKTEHDDRYLETAKVIKDVIVPTYKPWKMDVLGGELAILDPKLCNIMADMGIYIFAMTNGSNLKWFEPLIGTSHMIRISIHETQIDLDKLKKDVEFYLDKGMNIWLTTVLTKYNIESIKYMKKIMPIKVDAFQEQYTSIEKLDKTLICKNSAPSDKYVGKKCHCRTNMLHINQHGELTRCHCSREKIFQDHLANHDKKEIESAINNILNEPIINCDYACFPCIATAIQYHKEKEDEIIDISKLI